VIYYVCASAVHVCDVTHLHVSHVTHLIFAEQMCDTDGYMHISIFILIVCQYTYFCVYAQVYVCIRIYTYIYVFIVCVHIYMYK